MSNTIHVNVSGTWKTADSYHVNVGGTWKTGSGIGPKISSAWKGVDTVSTTNLKFHLDAGDSSSYGGSGTTWYDLTDENHDGTIDGATYSTSDGGIFDFDGTDDHVEFPDSDDWHIDTDYTIECWFNCDAVGGGFNSICGQWKESGLDAANSWILEYVGTDLRFYYIPDGASGHSNESLGDVSTGAWHHCALTRSGTTTKLFIDNSQVGSDFTMNTLQDGTGVFTVGGDVSGSGWFNGQIAQVRVYKGTGLTDAQITNNYNATKATFGL